MKPVALITGASSGIGLELARVHAARGGDLILVARRKDKLDALAAELEKAHGTRSYVMVSDLSKPAAPRALFDAVQTAGLRVDYLINNAGFGGYGFFHERSWEQDLAQLQVNIIALTELTRLYLPVMVRRNAGKILNVGSTAGFVPGPLQAVYYATKAYVQSFGQAIANEVKNTSVTVTTLCPGATHTEFAKAAGLENVRLFRLHRATAASVAEYGYDAMLQGKVIAIPGWQNRWMVRLMRFAPRKVLTEVSRQTMATVK